MAKYTDIADTLKERIDRGDYNLKAIPTERELAEQVGVARRTARQALLHLLDQGFIDRKPNGRLVVSKLSSKGHERLQFAFLAPAYPSDDVARWQLAAQRTAQKYNAVLRPVYYVHWNDPVILDALEGFDGIFLVPIPEPLPEGFIQRLRDTGCPLVLTCGDWSKYGVPSVTLCPPEWMHRILDYLERLGHTNISLVNAQPHDDTTLSRIEQWNLWRTVHGFEGELYDFHVQPYEWATQKAYEEMNRILDEGKFNSTAIVTTTDESSISVSSALIDHGYKVGEDVSVATMNDGGMCKLVRPSITCLEMPDAMPYLSVCMDWMIRGGKKWIGSLLVKPPSVPLFEGQSTGPSKTA